MFIIVFFLTVIFNVVSAVDDNVNKLIDLLPDEEKQEFLNNIARRILGEIKSKKTGKNVTEISDGELETHNAYIHKLVNEESSNLKTKRKSSNLTSDNDRRNDDHSRNYIDLTLRQGLDHETDQPKDELPKYSTRDLHTATLPVIYDQTVKTKNGKSGLGDANEDVNFESDVDIQVINYRKPKSSARTKEAPIINKLNVNTEDIDDIKYTIMKKSKENDSTIYRNKISTTANTSSSDADDVISNTTIRPNLYIKHVVSASHKYIDTNSSNDNITLEPINSSFTSNHTTAREIMETNVSLLLIDHSGNTDNTLRRQMDYEIDTNVEIDKKNSVVKNSESTVSSLIFENSIITTSIPFEYAHATDKNDNYTTEVLNQNHLIFFTEANNIDDKISETISWAKTTENSWTTLTLSDSIQTTKKYDFVLPINHALKNELRNFTETEVNKKGSIINYNDSDSENSFLETSSLLKADDSTITLIPINNYHTTEVQSTLIHLNNNSTAAEVTTENPINKNSTMTSFKYVTERNPMRIDDVNKKKIENFTKALYNVKDFIDNYSNENEEKNIRNMTTENNLRILTSPYILTTQWQADTRGNIENYNNNKIDHSVLETSSSYKADDFTTLIPLNNFQIKEAGIDLYHPNNNLTLSELSSNDSNNNMTTLTKFKLMLDSTNIPIYTNDVIKNNNTEHFTKVENNVVNINHNSSKKKSLNSSEKLQHTIETELNLVKDHENIYNSVVDTSLLYKADDSTIITPLNELKTKELPNIRIHLKNFTEEEANTNYAIDKASYNNTKKNVLVATTDNYYTTSSLPMNNNQLENSIIFSRNYESVLRVGVTKNKSEISRHMDTKKTYKSTDTILEEVTDNHLENNRSVKVLNNNISVIDKTDGPFRNIVNIFNYAKKNNLTLFIDKSITSKSTDTAPNIDNYTQYLIGKRQIYKGKIKFSEDTKPSVRHYDVFEISPNDKPFKIKSQKLQEDKTNTADTNNKYHLEPSNSASQQSKGNLKSRINQKYYIENLNSRNSIKNIKKYPKSFRRSKHYYSKHKKSMPRDHDDINFNFDEYFDIEYDFGRKKEGYVFEPTDSYESDISASSSEEINHDKLIFRSQYVSDSDYDTKGLSIPSSNEELHPINSKKISDKNSILGPFARQVLIENKYFRYVPAITEISTFNFDKFSGSETEDANDYDSKYPRHKMLRLKDNISKMIFFRTGEETTLEEAEFLLETTTDHSGEIITETTKTSRNRKTTKEPKTEAPETTTEIITTTQTQRPNHKNYIPFQDGPQPNPLNVVIYNQRMAAKKIFNRMSKWTFEELKNNDVFNLRSREDFEKLYNYVENYYVKYPWLLKRDEWEHLMTLLIDLIEWTKTTTSTTITTEETTVDSTTNTDMSTDTTIETSTETNAYTSTQSYTTTDNYVSTITYMNTEEISTTDFTTEVYTTTEPEYEFENYGELRRTETKIEVKDEIDIYCNVLEDMLKKDSKALKQYDWLGTTVDIQSALQKLTDLIHEINIKGIKSVHRADLQILKYTTLLHQRATKAHRNVTTIKKAATRNLLPKNKKRKFGEKIKNPLALLVHSRNQLRATTFKPDPMVTSRFQPLNIFLEEIIMHLSDLHNALKQIAIITKYSKQKWYENLKQLYLSKPTKVNLLEVLLHLFTNRLFQLIEDSSGRGVEDSYKKYVKTTKREVKRTKEELVFILKLMERIKILSI